MSADKRVDAVLVGLLLVLFDFPVGGVDIVPDVVGWALLAFGLPSLFGPGRLAAGTVAVAVGRTLCCVLAVLAGLVVVWRFTGPPALPFETGLLLALFMGLAEVVVPGLLCLLGARLAAAWASRATLLLTIGWKVAAGSAAVLALTTGPLLVGVAVPAQGLLSVVGALGSFAAGVLALIGLYQLREQGLLG